MHVMKFEMHVLFSWIFEQSSRLQGFEKTKFFEQI